MANKSAEIQSFIDYLKFEKRYSTHTIISYETDIKSFFSIPGEKFWRYTSGRNNSQYHTQLAGLTKGGKTYLKINQPKNLHTSVFF